MVRRSSRSRGGTQSTKPNHAAPAHVIKGLRHLCQGHEDAVSAMLGASSGTDLDALGPLLVEKVMKVNSISAETMLAQYFPKPILVDACERMNLKSAKGNAITLAARIVKAWDKGMIPSTTSAPGSAVGTAGAGTPRFFVIRHGQSTANVQGIICSASKGLTEYGLSETGREQAREAGELLKSELKGNVKNVRLISSDFTRTRETAEIVAAVIGKPMEIDKRLRERSFGDFDLKSSANYHKVWTNDAKSCSHTYDNVESVAAVAKRASQAVMEAEKDARANGHAVVVLVGHGDTLQILQTWAAGRDLRHHRQMKHLENGELREIELERASAPPKHT